MKKVFLFLLVGMFILSFASAVEDTVYTLNEDMEINNFCPAGNCSYMNLTSLEYPNGTINYFNEGMINHNQLFTYSFTPDQVGKYYFITCDNNNCENNNFLVTPNGQPSPEGIVVVMFSVLLLFVLSYSVVMIVKAVGHMIDKDFDLMDVAVMWGMFFGLLGLNQLAIIYLGNVDVNNWLDLFVNIYAFPMVIVPVIAFFLSLFNVSKEKKRKAQQW